MKLLIISKIKNYAVTINLNNYDSEFKEVENNQHFDLQNKLISPSKKPEGFSCITKYNNKIIIGTQKSLFFYILDDDLNYNCEKVFIGTPIKEIKTYKNRALILCSDINALIVYDLLEKKFLFEIPTGNYPFSFEVNSNNNTIYICSFLEQKMIAIDADNYSKIYEINGLQYPVQVLNINNNICTLESSFDSFRNGIIRVIGSNFESKIKVQKAPVCMAYDLGCIYVLDAESGEIDVVNMDKNIVIKKYKKVGIMPVNMLIVDDYIYVTDYYTGNIMEINKKTGKKIKIAEVEEPSAMLIV